MRCCKLEGGIHILFTLFFKCRIWILSKLIKLNFAEYGEIITSEKMLEKILANVEVI